MYLSLCVFLDVAYDKRPIQRFWFLETVARMPYFSYISCLHLLARGARGARGCLRRRPAPAAA